MHNKVETDNMAERIEVIQKDIEHIYETLTEIKDTLKEFNHYNRELENKVRDHEAVIKEVVTKEIIEKVESYETTIGFIKWIASIGGFAAISSLVIHMFK